MTRSFLCWILGHDYFAPDHIPKLTFWYSKDGYYSICLRCGKRGITRMERDWK